MQIIKIPYVKNPLNEEKERNVPQRILEQLKEDYEKFDDLDLEEIHVDNNKPEEAEKLILENSAEELARQDCVVFLCSEFEVKRWLCKSFHEVYDNGFLIFISNRLDLSLFEGVDLKNVVLICSKLNKNEKIILDKLGIKYFADILDFEAAADFITEKANRKDTYVSVDLSVVDSAFAPGAQFSDVLGLSSRELLYLLKRFFHLKTLRAFDITGISLIKDEKYDFRTIKLTAKILDEFLKTKNG